MTTAPSAPPDGSLVLVVEDDPAIATMLRLQLEVAGHRVATARDGRAALDTVQRDHPDVVLLDIGLPGLDGIEVCRTLRAGGDWTPVIFLTARDDEVDRVVGLELGADDYVTKPFSPREVVARIASVLRRSSRPELPGDDEVLALGEVRLRPRERQVFVAGDEVVLTATEFDLLQHLMASPGRVWTREQLLEHVWGFDTPSGRRTVDVHVAQVRAKLGAHDVIRTVRGVGYAARAPRDQPAP
ncbi:response regulator transcription factor [Lapillicoccus jejuensis]|uniref:DNA-binding response OmpR family regulator n=1 Tax=Lapillicoccus jejuensis TaxID=402171 RepID=A0A542E6P4_9MICO|nr:response regulator transcription factor [Lapillicoccus jejuensis]TQJ10997.1 DNA-binding response OmpR family regulator [Lapillicoccus jejuensis]